MKPRLEIKAASIRGLRALDALEVSNTSGIVVIGGEAGSGKSTLLEFLAASLEAMHKRAWPAHLSPDQGSWVEYLVSGAAGHERVRFVIGSSDYVALQSRVPSYSVVTGEIGAPRLNVRDNSDVVRALRPAFPTRPEGLELPTAVYFPAQRGLHTPSTTYRFAGKSVEKLDFLTRWTQPRSWRESLEAQLYAARWEDLNAREEGRDEDVGHFAGYVEAFEVATGGTKSLVWLNGELVVRIEASGRTHDLAGLSSGEAQMLLFSAELRRRWRPGSLILVDEPELHMSPRWQRLLFAALERWHAQLGGQVVLATSSDVFWELAGEERRFWLGEREE